MKRTALSGLTIAALLCCSGIAFTQTGPGGIGSAATNLLWLDGERGTYQSSEEEAVSNNDPVYNWLDQSGNGHDFSAGTKNPKLKTGNNGINGINAIYFQGTGQALVDTNGENYVNGLSEFTFFFVVKSDSVNSDRGIWDTEVPDGEDDVLALRYDAQATNGNASNLVRAGIHSPSPTNQVESSSSRQSTTPQIITFDWKSGSELSLYFNGLQDTPSYGSGAIPGSISGATNTTLGKGSQGGVSQGWAGKITETILYNYKLTDLDKRVIHNYLSSKYDISISSAMDHYAGDFSVNGNYDHGVTGLEGRWKRLWYFDVTDANNSMYFDITFDKSEAGAEGATGVPVNYKLLYRSSQSGNWQSIATSNQTTGDRIYFENVNIGSSGDGYYTLGSTDMVASPLPVELLYFKARQRGSSVQLNWATASETNSAFFSLQKSFDGKNFKTFATVRAAGESHQTKTYREFDPTPFLPVTYYRLKEQDLDGTVQYSSIIPVQLPSPIGQGITLYPNPADKIIRISVTTRNPNPIRVILTSSSGKIIQDKTYTLKRGRNNIPMEVDQHPSGWYWLNIITPEREVTRKLVINR